MEQQGRVLDGDLETLGLQSTLKMLSLGAKTGVLSVTSGQEHLRIQLENGNILSLDEPGHPPPDLIEIFRLQGVIDGDMALRLRQDSGNYPDTALMLMAQRRLISPDDIQRRVEFTVIQALSRAVKWEHGRFEFHRDQGTPAPRAGFSRPLNIDHVLLEALRVADEREHHDGGMVLSRYAVPRWTPQAPTSVNQLSASLSQEELAILRLCNGQLALYAMSAGLLVMESQIARIAQRLLSLGLIEIVDALLESELQRNLLNMREYTRAELAKVSKGSYEQRMLALARILTECANALLTHHMHFASSLRGRGEISKVEGSRYIETVFAPLLAHVQRVFPRMDEIIRLEDGRINANDVETLDHVVKGQELVECYQDATLLLAELIQIIFERVLADEAGPARPGRQYEEIWSAFSTEVESEISRLIGRQSVARA